ncbi:cytochrome c-type biogenesis protein CcmH [Martelella lutilitoris]|uniref:Cytochrome c-type biogenesis protein n=1 Tax=Martelella lutilitoris TaxID=2583532 RepID=A0A7T7KK01_9HYPH|nr:cytochrome c-type biogenesis protein [Martelella lutilitoris]QQM29210.1 cytochrome c-type biogenesis protein CcmH [Martelella lutilitoris]
MKFAALLVVVLLLAPLTAAQAVTPDEVLDDPALEARAREISAELRCMVCQNQSIDDSNADLARDLRLLVRDRLVDGDSNEEVIDYVVSRYGEFVLLKPRFSPKTWLLWGAPALLVVIGGIVVWRLSKSRRAPDRPLSPAEEERLERLLADGDDN